MYGLFIKRMQSCSTTVPKVHKFKQFYPLEYGGPISPKRPVTNIRKKHAIKNEKVMEAIQ